MKNKISSMAINTTYGKMAHESSIKDIFKDNIEEMRSYIDKL